MKKLFLLIYFALIFSQVLGQKINVDSLTQVAISRFTSAKRVLTINRDSLLQLLPITKSPAARIKIIYDIEQNYDILNPKQVLYYHYKILDLTQKNNDLVGEAVITAELGFTIAKNGNNAEGIKLIFKAEKLAEETGNKEAIGIVYDNLALCYDNPVLSKFYCKKALQFSQLAFDYQSISYELSFLSRIFQQQHQADSAIYYRLKCYDLSVRKNIEMSIPYNLIELGQLQIEAKDQLKYYRAALKILSVLKDGEQTINAMVAIANYYQKQGKTDSALFYAKKAYTVSHDVSLNYREAPVRFLAREYTGSNADSALKYTTIYYTLHDSIYNINSFERAQSMAFTDQQRQREMALQKAAYESNLRLYILLSIIAFLVLSAFIFWRSNRQNKKSNLLLKSQKEQIQKTLHELKATQAQLIQSEKMASLGELTAGIAHEIQNPLNFVNNFSEVNTELLAELQQEISAKNYEEVSAIADEIIGNEQKINLHGKRADAIVKGMLQHSQSGSGAKELTNINSLAHEYLRLAYHGLRSKDKSFNVDMVTHFEDKLPLINVIPQDIGRVMLNLFNNAFYAVNEKQKTTGPDYKPEVSVSTLTENKHVIIKVKDNGIGISEAIKDKIMQPFFTTKPTGEGTGLGLSLTYDMVVNGHGGSIQVVSAEGEGSEFIIKLPSNT